MGFSDKSFFNRLMLLIFVILGGAILSSVSYLLIVFVKSGFDIEQFSILSAQSANSTEMILILQFLSSICFFILPPFILTYLYKEKPSIFLSFKKPQPVQIILAILSIVFAIPIINYLVIWNESIHLPAYMSEIEIWMRSSEQTAAKLTEQILSGTSWTDLIANLIIIAIMAGFGEELFFRGLLQKLVSDLFNNQSDEARAKRQKWTNHATIWIIAFIFSAIHFQFYGFFPRLLLGAWFGYLLLWTGSIWVPIIAHTANNALSTIFNFIEKREILIVNPESAGTNETEWYNIISLLLIICCVVMFKKIQNTTFANQTE